MRVIYPLYYGESIPKKKHDTIRQQIEKREFSKANEWYIVVLYQDKETLFEKISIKEFEHHCKMNKDFDVLAVVKTNEEFQTFTLQIMELLIGKTKTVTKKGLINYYRESNNEDIKV
jgi:hypothetical protein